MERDSEIGYCVTEKGEYIIKTVSTKAELNLMVFMIVSIRKMLISY
jgi:hypothetical protein